MIISGSLAHYCMAKITMHKCDIAVLFNLFSKLLYTE